MRGHMLITLDGSNITAIKPSKIAVIQVSILNLTIEFTFCGESSLTNGYDGLDQLFQGLSAILDAIGDDNYVEIPSPEASTIFVIDNVEAVRMEETKKGYLLKTYTPQLTVVTEFDKKDKDICRGYLDRLGAY